MVNSSENLRWYQIERIKGYCLGQLGEVEKGIEYLEDALNGFRELLNKAEDKALEYQLNHDLSITLTDLGIIYYEYGYLFESQACITEALHRKRKMNINISSIAAGLNNVGYLYYQTGKYKKAWDAFQEALELLKNVELDRIKVNLFSSLGDLQRDIEEWNNAEQSYRQAIETAEKTGGIALLYASFLGIAELEKLSGNYNEAFHWLRKAALERQLSPDSPIYQAKIGSIYLEMGQLDLAINALRQSFGQWEDLPRPHQDQVLAAFLLGNAFFHQNNKEEALSCLKKALELSARLGYDQFLVVSGRRARQFLNHAIQVWPDNLQLRSLVERIESFQTGQAQFQNQTISIDQPKTYLELLAFGHSLVRLNGEIIPKSVWRSSKPRALLFYILDRNGAHSSDIKLDFWPEFGPNRANSNFQATLWRTRKAIGGKEFLINKEDKYILSPQINFWYDTKEFLNYLKQSSEKYLTPSEKAELWRQAIDLYQGDYLEDIFMEWTERRRNELLALYLQTLVSLANWEATRQNFESAKVLFERVINLEPLRDDIHLSIMKCDVQTGAISLAKSHYLDYQSLLSEQGLEPAPELKNYYHNLIKRG